MVAQSYGRKVDMNAKAVGEADVDIKEFVDAKANVDIKELVDAKVDMNEDSGMTNANRPPLFPQGFFYFAFNYIMWNPLKTINVRFKIFGFSNCSFRLLLQVVQIPILTYW